MNVCELSAKISAGTEEVCKPRNDSDAMLNGCTGLDDPTYVAASVLADGWQHALAASYRLGFDYGHDLGYWLAEREMAEAWHNAAEPIRATLTAPTQAEMAERRGQRPTRCERDCGGCSRCTCALAADENMRRYGTPAFPDAATRARLDRGAV